ncbi:MAG: hypothetical protein Q7V57_14205 [Actinomycetota bacterium]|nr:hypothetical protein [Actinomycetota bacterium]
METIQPRILESSGDERPELPICSLDSGWVLVHSARVFRRSAVVIAVAIMGAMASCSFFVSGGDRGITYTFTNRCEQSVVVVLASGGREVRLDPGSTDSIHTLDQQPDSIFVIQGVSGGVEVRFAPGDATFEIREGRCPAG